MTEDEGRRRTRDALILMFGILAAWCGPWVIIIIIGALILRCVGVL